MGLCRGPPGLASELQGQIVLDILLHLVMLDYAGLVLPLRDVPEVQPEVLRELLALVPPQWTAAGPEQCRIFNHFLDFDLDHLLVADCDPLKLEFVTRLRATLQNDLRVMHVHNLGGG